MRVSAAAGASPGGPVAREPIGDGDRSPHVQRTTSQSSSRIASSRRFSSNTASPGVLAGAQQPAVLDASVELADEPLVLPGEVACGRRSTPSGGPDLELQGGRRESQLVQDHAAADSRRRSRSARRRSATPVRRAGCPACRRCRTGACAGPRAIRARRAVRRRASTTAASNGRLTRQIERRAHEVGHLRCPPTTVTSSSRSRATWQRRRRWCLAPGAGPARDVHAIERDVPQRAARAGPRPD